MWDEDIFKAGQNFKLETVNDSNKRQFMPFSSGRRNCIGHLLSQMEMKVFASFIFSRFRMTPITKLEEARYTLALTMKLNPCKVAFHPISYNK